MVYIKLPSHFKYVRVPCKWIHCLWKTAAEAGNQGKELGDGGGEERKTFPRGVLPETSEFYTQ